MEGPTALECCQVVPQGPVGPSWQRWPGGKLTQGLSKVSRCPPARAAVRRRWCQPGLGVVRAASDTPPPTATWISRYQQTVASYLGSWLAYPPLGLASPADFRNSIVLRAGWPRPASSIHAGQPIRRGCDTSLCLITTQRKTYSTRVVRCCGTPVPSPGVMAAAVCPSRP